jgi:hypothetical protein
VQAGPRLALLIIDAAAACSRISSSKRFGLRERMAGDFERFERLTGQTG